MCIASIVGKFVVVGEVIVNLLNARGREATETHKKVQRQIDLVLTSYAYTYFGALCI